MSLTQSSVLEDYMEMGVMVGMGDAGMVINVHIWACTGVTGR